MQRILVIEDDEKLARILQLQLERENYIVKNIYDGLEGLNYIEKNKNSIHLILLDLNIPGISGEKLCSSIKSFGIPIIVISAKSDVEDKVSLLSNGAIDYVTKPFNFLELSARIRLQILPEEKMKS